MSTARYPFSTMRERLRGRADVLDFAIGSGSAGVSPDLADLVRENPTAAWQRSSQIDIEQVQHAAAEFLACEYAVDVDPSDVLAAPGGRSALAAIVASLLTAGNQVVHTDPAYPTFGAVAARSGVSIQPLVLEPSRHFQPDAGSLPDTAHAADLVSLNFPNNPTGALLPDGFIADLGRLMRTGTVIFNDATLGPLTYEGVSRSILAHARDAQIEQPVLELHSIGKLLGVLGVPLSFMVGTREVIEQIRAYTDYVWTPPSCMQSRLAAACLRDRSSVGNARERCRLRMSRLVDTLHAIGLDPFPAPSGLYVLCPAPKTIAGDRVTGAQNAADALFDRLSLAVMAWDAPGGGYLRFSSLYRDEDIESLAALGRVS